MLSLNVGYSPGQMRLNGTTDEANSSPQTGGLRLNGNSSVSAADAITKQKNVADNFATTMFSRLEGIKGIGDPDSQKSLQETMAFMESLTSVISEIKDKFGNESANQAMADILTKTQDDLSGDQIAGAISGVLAGLARPDADTSSNPDASARAPLL